MPNLEKPISTTRAALEYRKRILSSLPDSAKDFQPLMTLYLTKDTTPTEIETAATTKCITGRCVMGVKYYPRGGTTHSLFGVRNLFEPSVQLVLNKMAELKMPLLVHGEVTDPDVDIFDREAVFIDTVLRPLVRLQPKLKIVLEHISTSRAVDFVLAAGPNIAATITAHHLLLNRNDMFDNGIRPHLFCRPVLKRRTDCLSLLRAVASGHDRFFAGTDSAPHCRKTKESCCGPAGCFTSHAAVELYAEAFDGVQSLDKLEAFLCVNGARFYGLPLNRDCSRTRIKLVRREWRVPKSYTFDAGADIVPIRAGEIIPWSIASKL